MSTGCQTITIITKKNQCYHCLKHKQKLKKIQRGIVRIVPNLEDALQWKF